MMVRILALALVGGAVVAPSSRPERALEQEVEDLKRNVEVLTARLSDMERHIDGEHGLILSPSVGAAAAPTKIHAPFEVVDAGGKTLFRVSENVGQGGTFAIMNNSGKEVAWGSALANGGMFKVRSTATFPEVTIGSVGSYGGLLLRDGENQHRAALVIENGKPILSLHNDNHVAVASLTQGTSGGGHFQLGDAAGRIVVNAGVTAGGCGKVETIPGRPVRATALGVPGDMIVGNC
jgi:hypothetical protein